MHTILARFRGPLVALVVLALSAGAVLAGEGMPAASEFGLSVAEAASGKTVPVRAGQVDETDEAEPTPEPTDEATTTEPEEGESTEESEESLAETEGWDTHGELVSTAAQLDELPEGFVNRGQFVSCVARMNRGHDAQPEADFDPSTLTPEDCSADDDGDESEAAEGETETDVQASADGGPGKSAAAKERAAARKALRGSGPGRGR